MPKSWRDIHTVNKIEDDTTKGFYRSIVADKKPYFMKYIYPALMKQYNTYIKNTNRNALREFQMTVDEMMEIPADRLSERQKDFLRYYNYRMPVGVGDCVMNKICRRFEEEFDGFIKQSVNNQNFDYRIMKSDVEYTPRQYTAIKRLYEEYKKRAINYSIFADYERIDNIDSINTMSIINEEFRAACNKVCSNSKSLCNIILDICYNRNSTKKFAWSMCGKQIIKNLLYANDNTISFPELDDDGDITFGGHRFKIKSKVIGADV